MSTIFEGDVLSVAVRFSGLSIGFIGVCTNVEQRNNGVVHMTILMQNGDFVTLTERETYMFFRKKGVMNLVDKTNNELIHQLGLFN